MDVAGRIRRDGGVEILHRPEQAARVPVEGRQRGGFTPGRKHRKESKQAHARPSKQASCHPPLRLRPGRRVAESTTSMSHWWCTLVPGDLFDMKRFLRWLTRVTAFRIGLFTGLVFAYVHIRQIAGRDDIPILTRMEDALTD